MKFCSLHLYLFTFLYFFLSHHFVVAQDTILLQGDVKQVNSSSKERYFYSADDIPIEQVIPGKFVSRNEVRLNYINGWIWIKFIVKNNSSNDDRFVIHTTSGHISGLYMYKPTPSGSYEMTPAKIHHPEDGREVFNRLPTFFLDLKKGETKSFYIKIHAQNELVKFTYIIRNYAHYSEYAQADYMIFGLYFGALLIIIVVNIFYYIALKDHLFLVYSIYAVGTFLFTATLDGFMWLLIPDPDIAYHLCYFSLRFWPDALIFFTVQLVDLRYFHKKLAIAAYSFIGYHTLFMPILEFTNAFNINVDKMAQWEIINCILGIIFVFTIVAVSYSDKKYLLKYYLIAFSVLVITILFMPLYAFGGAENYLLLQHGVKAGTLFEMLTLSFAVSRRFRLTQNDLKKRQKEEAQLTEKINQLEINVRKAQMNPHFIFNALSSIEYFILKNNQEQARRYLSKFAQLMRLTLDNSRNNYISLSDELSALKLYIELEFLRLAPVQHTYEINLGDGIDADIIHIPALLIQPFVENAIWHGLQKKNAPGKLIIDISLHENELRCTVEDDGGGIERKAVPISRKTSGIQITKERLTLIHGILHSNYKFNILDIKKDDGETVGTCVYLNMPFISEY